MKCPVVEMGARDLWLLYTIFIFLSVDDGVALVYDMPGYMKPYVVARKGHEKQYEIGSSGVVGSGFEHISH